MEFRAFSKKLNKMFNHPQIDFWNNKTGLMARCGASPSCEGYDTTCELSIYTGFRDCNGLKIFEGDIISDKTETDEGIIESKQQVFWNGKMGAWCLDESFKQDKSSSGLLSEQLELFEYRVIGNIYRK